MLLDPAHADPSVIYSMMIRSINPRPIAWVSTISPGGIFNLAPFSYFNGVGSQPAALMFSVVNLPDGSKKDTVINIEATKQFVVNVVPFSAATSMAKTAVAHDYEVSEFDEVNLTPRASHRVKPPAVAESPIQFECELVQVVNVGSGPGAANVVIGKVLLIHVDDEVLDDAGKIDPEKLDTIGRMGGRDYCRTTARFSVPSS